MSKTVWPRVTKQRPCPICGSPDWCIVSPDGTAVICPRTEQGAVRHVPDSGWLHKLDGAIELPALPPPERKPVINTPSLATEYCRALGKHAGELSKKLGVTELSLWRLGIGWSAKHRAYTFPMRNAMDKVIGIRLRHLDGRKRAVRGSKTGLFIPNNLSGGGWLLICEGPTDAAAMLDQGFDTIGRPSCNAGILFCCQYLAISRRIRVCVVADADKPGLDGARRLREALTQRGRRVVVIQPPAGVKDAREWAKRGDIRAEVEQTIRRA